MAFDYNAARANRFAKRHRKVAAKLTGPIESELAKTKKENEKQEYVGIYTPKDVD